MQTWIFQGNPDYFDIDGYFATDPGRFVWPVTRYADDMRPGDRVFIFRTGRAAGVVADAEIIGAPTAQAEDPEAVRFWSGDHAGAMEVRSRVPLSLLRVAGNREVLRRDWLREDPVLQDLPNLKWRRAPTTQLRTGTQRD